MGFQLLVYPALIASTFFYRKEEEGRKRGKGNVQRKSDKAKRKTQKPRKKEEGMKGKEQK